MTQVRVPRGMATSMFLRLFSAQPQNCQHLSVAGAPRFRAPGSSSSPERYCTGDGAGAVHDLLQGACRNDFAAVDARAGANVHNIIRRAHGVLVVLHHNQRVAQIPQLLQGVRAACRCPAGAGRWRARPEYRARPSERSRSGWQDGCAGFRRRTGCRQRGCRVRYSRPTLLQKAQPGTDLPENLLRDHPLSAGELADGSMNSSS